MPTAFHRHIALTFIAALLAACVNEPTDNFLPPPDPAPAAAAEAELLFRIAIPKNEEQAGTRAMTDADERTVKQLDVLAFAEDDDTFRFAYYTAGGEATISNASESRQTFKVKAGVMSARQQFVIIANARDAVDAVVASMTGKSRDEALALLQINLSSGRFPAVSNKIETYMPIPMWGESSPVVIDNSSDEVVVSTGEDPIKLLRMTARIDVLIDETAEAQPNEVFQMTRVMVYNYHTDGHIVPGSAHLNRETMIATTATLPTAATPTRGPITFTASSPTACTQEIYILEADNSTAADKTCLVVGGRYEGDAADSYYRIDFVQTDDEGAPAYADVLRNHRYQFKITEVQGPGYATADEAFDHAPMNMKVEWYTWDQGAAEHIAFDKDTYLSVSHTDYLFNANESYSGMGAGDKNVVEVYSNHADGWHIKSIEDAAGDDATWLTLYEPTTPPALIANNAAQQGKKKLYFHFDDNATGADRTAVITFAAGRLENRVTVTQNGDIVAFVQLFHVADNVAGNVAGNEIADGSIITFDANTGDTPAAKSLMVRWSPGDSPVTVSVAYNAEKAHFVTATTNFTDGQVISGSTTGEVSKEETFVFDPPAIPGTAGEDERWHGREVTLTFSVGGVSRTVILRQVNYVATFSTGLPGVDNNIYLIDNENKAFYVRANFNWRVAISDGGGIIDEADGLISSTTGGVNTSLPQGRAVNFRFLDWSGQYDTDAIAHKDELPTTSTLTIYRITDDNMAGNDVVFSTHTIRGTPMRVRPVDGFLAGTNAVDSVPTLGGSSVAFDVEGKSNYVWKARLTMTAGKRTKDGEEYALVNHRVYLTDEYGTDIALTPTDLTMPYSASDQSPLVFETGSRNFSESFRVRYPMLYFPNREIPAITTVVRVYLVAGGQEIEMPVDMSQVSVGQQALTKQQRDKVWSPDGISGDAWPDTWGGCSAADAGWGSVRSYYMGTINELLRSTFWNPSAPKVYFSQKASSLPGEKEEYGYIQLGMGQMRETSTKPLWSDIERYWKKGTNTPDDDAVLWVQGDNSMGGANATYMNAHLPQGYEVWESNAGSGTPNTYVKAFPEEQMKQKGERIYHFLTGGDNSGTYVVSDISKLGFRELDTYHSELQSWPATAIPILYNRNEANVILAIDPTTNFLFVGESQLYPNSGTPGDGTANGNTLALFYNFIQYIIDTAGYGGSFSRMLVDTCPVPPPWDNAWGNNKYPN